MSSQKTYTKEQVRERVAMLIKQATKHFKGVIPTPRVYFDLLGRTAGQARGTHTIRINADLLKRYPEEIYGETVAHETAHIVVHKVFPGARPHGREWKGVMSLFGYPNPSRTHSMEVRPARTHTKHTYRCACKTHVIGATRHKRMQEGSRKYSCKLCHSYITLV